MLRAYGKRVVYRVFRYCIGLAAKDTLLCEQIQTLGDSAAFAREHLVHAQDFRDRWQIIDFALSQVRIPGLYVECGVFQGESLNYIARKKKDATIHGFDSFEGLPEDWRPGYGHGIFRIKDRDKLVFGPNVEIHRGWFSETMNAFARSSPENVSFLHVDSDLYSSAVDIFTALANKITHGTIILFDEYYNHPGWRDGEHKAFQEYVTRSNKQFRYIAYNSASEQVVVAIL
jgi:predicted O-methyltransferase YrrM